MHRGYFRPRPKKRRIFWGGWKDEIAVCALLTIVAIQAVRLLVRPTLVDLLLFIAALVALLPQVL